jgi:MFS family permease
MILKFSLPQLSHFQRDVRLLFAATGIFAVSFFGIQQLLKVLYILRLGYGLEYVGLFNATGAMAYMLMSIPSGILSDRFGTRVVMLAGGILTVIGMAALPLSEAVPSWAGRAWPIISQLILTGGWSMFNVNMVPALMSWTTPQDRNQAYALTSVLRGLGTFAGTISGGLLPGLFVYLFAQSLDDPEPYRWSLWVGAGLGLLGLAPLVLVSPVKGAVVSGYEQGAGPFPVLPLAVVIIYVYFSHGAWATCQAFCNAYLDTNLQLSAASIGLITGVGQFAAILAPLLNPRLAARYSNGWILLITTVGTGLSLLPLALLTHWSAASLGILGVMALAAAWMPAFQVYQMELVNSRWRSLAYGIVSMAMGFTFASISLIGGYIAAEWGYRSLFLLGVAMCVVGSVLMWAMLRRSFEQSLASELR